MVKTPNEKREHTREVIISTIFVVSILTVVSLIIHLSVENKAFQVLPSVEDVMVTKAFDDGFCLGFDTDSPPPHVSERYFTETFKNY